MPCNLEEAELLEVLEMDMMDKRKYYPLIFTQGILIRSLTHPLMLIKTRLQVQRGKTVYKGAFDALFKIGRAEGRAGLYRGFWASCLQLCPTLVYITTYEHTRQAMAERLNITNNGIRSFVGGGLASCAGQTIAVPIDVVTQHLMLMGSSKDNKSGKSESSLSDSLKRIKAEKQLSSLQNVQISEADKRSRFGAVQSIVRQIRVNEGFLGFYKGYWISIASAAPSSALWWLFYDQYQNIFASVAPESVPRLLIQAVSGAMAGMTSITITNPIDVIKTRIQVEGTAFSETCALLWKQEGMRVVTKGLSARLVLSATISSALIVGYETTKRLSLLDEHKDKGRW